MKNLGRILTCGLALSIEVYGVSFLPGARAAEDQPADRPIKVVQPRLLAGDDIPAVRTPLGIPIDYKPWIVQLQNGDLLIVAFCYGGQPSNKLAPGEPYLERAVFWRSADGGKTWGPREERPDIHGREFSLTCLSDGTLIMPCHFLANDAANKAGHTYGEMYPRFLRLQDGRLLLTFTVRSNSTDGHPLGLRALISPDDGETWDFAHDRIVISDRNHGASGGGFGNTIQRKDGSLVSVYSYRGEDDNTHVEAVRWTLPKMQSKP